MNPLDLLRLLDAQIEPPRCKIHLASWNGSEDPLDEYLAGRFDAWQSWQNKRNFERPVVVSLIQLSPSNRWLLAGVYDSLGCQWVEQPPPSHYVYRLDRRTTTTELEGRLVVRFERPGRQSYLLAERWGDKLEVAEILRERMQVEEFPGYASAMLTKQRLDIVVSHGLESWRSALSSVAGVYVITDRKTGKLYVGSATGIGGIWTRWCSYSSNGHGGNKELVEILRTNGVDYAENYQFGVLEIADTHASSDDIRRRESHWKDLLCSRVPHGYNAN